MLGRVFESLLATQIDDTGEQARKAKGAFYTPREIVGYMCRESLREYLYNELDDEDSAREAISNLLDISDSEWAKAKSNNVRDKIKSYRANIIDALDKVTILDPACGSGAFPMGMLQLMLKTYERIENRFDPYATKLSVIQNNIFGVDIEPMAVEIARLRAWLSLVVDEGDGKDIAPLPNLDFKFVCANSLMPLDGNGQSSLLSDNDLHEKLKELRNKYFNARKPESKKKLQADYYKLINQKTLFDDRRTKQLQSFNPFINLHPADFFSADQMFGVSNGFRIVIGNPPYGAKVPNSDKKIYRDYYASAKTIPGKQKGSLDTFALFIDMGYNELSKLGNLSYIIPLTITSGDSMTSLHRLIFDNCKKVQISSYCDRPVQIFKNAHKKLSIISFTKTRSVSESVSMTKMHRLNNEDNLAELMNNLQFIDTKNLPMLPGRLPKISSEIEKVILNKLFNYKPLAELKKQDGVPVYYRSAGGMYFNVITNYPNNLSSEKTVRVEEKLVNPLAGILSSTLFWWYQQVYTDCLNIKASEIESFPIPIITPEFVEKLNNAYIKYADDIEKNVSIRESNSYKNITSFKEYKIRKSLKYIELIDDITCELYGLDDEETQFIKNYELEFRTDNTED
jgi:predicted RNA methylase